MGLERFQARLSSQTLCSFWTLLLAAYLFLCPVCVDPTSLAGLGVPEQFCPHGVGWALPSWKEMATGPDHERRVVSGSEDSASQVGMLERGWYLLSHTGSPSYSGLLFLASLAS